MKTSVEPARSWLRWLTACFGLALWLVLVPQHALAQSALDGFQANANGIVRAVAVQPDGKVLVGGNFTTIGGQSRNYIARLNADGSADASFNPNANSIVYSLAVQPDGKVLVGGDFTTIGGQTRNYIARLNADGSADASFNPDANGPVLSLAVQPDGKVLVGGDFTTIGGQTRYRIARLNADGSVDASFNPGADNSVVSLAVQPDGKVLVGGDFTTIGGQTRYRIARLNADGSVDASFNPGADNKVLSLAVQPDGKVLVGGVFTTIGGQTRNRIARLNADGSADASFNPDANNTVYSLAVQPDGKVLVGGLFATIGGQTRNHIARLNADGSVDASFNPGADNSVVSLAVQPDGKVLVGGVFTTIGGQTRNFIARLNADGSADASFNPNSSSTVYSLAVQPDGKVLVGGVFTTIGGQTRNFIARLSVPEAALQSLQATPAGTGVRWMRSGAGPEVSQVLFSVATVEDAPPGAWTDLGAGTRIAGGWGLDGLVLPKNTPIWVRAQGVATGGYFNGSSSLVRSVRQLVLLASAPGAPAGLAATAGSNAVSLSWTAPASDGGGAITGYTVTGAPSGSCTTTGALTCTVSGLTNGVAHTFTVTATNAAGTSSPSAPASATPLPWSQTGVVLPGGGSADVQVGAPPGCTISGAHFGTTVPPGAPAGASFPLGVFSFTAAGCTNATLPVRIDYPAGSLSGLQPYKYGPASAGAVPGWFPHGTVVGDSVVFSVTDNGVGDNNPVLGAITDPFAPALLPAGPPSATSIPTLSEWGLMALSIIAMAVGMGHLRRRTFR